MHWELDTQAWAKQQFGECELGDVRRTRRAVAYAAQVAAQPDASTPQQAEAWSDLKGAYALFDRKEVTFRALAEPHWRLTRASFARRRHVLLLNDTTEVCFTGRTKIAGIGMLNHEGHLGFLLHSALAVDARGSEVLGLAAQTIRHRRRTKQEHSGRRVKRTDRESRLWGDVIDEVGPPAVADLAVAETIYTHVCDRGADNFEVYCHLLRNKCHWVIRAAQLTRAVLYDGVRLKLAELLPALPVAGTYELEIRASAKQPARTALLEVRFASIVTPRPAAHGPYVKQSGIREIPMSVIEVREVPLCGKHSPKFEPLHWVLFTSHPVATFEQAYEIVGWYEQRPLIEEYHKALKTGCGLEERQYETAHRLEAVTGILAIAAVRLLQMKTVAKREPNRPAEEMIPRRWLKALRARRRKPINTVREFFREMAGLGGFLGRKCDGEPGWMTLWRGFEKLHLLVLAGEDD
jgi:hypothetical protein